MYTGAGIAEGKVLAFNRAFEPPIALTADEASQARRRDRSGRNRTRSSSTMSQPWELHDPVPESDRERAKRRRRQFGVSFIALLVVIG